MANRPWLCGLSYRIYCQLYWHSITTARRGRWCHCFDPHYTGERTSAKRLLYRVREHNKTSQTMKQEKKRNKEKKKKRKKQVKRKQSKTSDRCSEECDRRRSERKRKRCNCQRNTMHTCWRLVARAKQHEEYNCCCCTDETTRRR